MQQSPQYIEGLEMAAVGIKAHGLDWAAEYGQNRWGGKVFDADQWAEVHMSAGYMDFVAAVKVAEK